MAGGGGKTAAVFFGGLLAALRRAHVAPPLHRLEAAAPWMRCALAGEKGLGRDYPTAARRGDSSRTCATADAPVASPSGGACHRLLPLANTERVVDRSPGCSGSGRAGPTYRAHRICAASSGTTAPG